MPQNNYKEVIEEFNDYSKNISIEKFMKMWMKLNKS